MALTRDEHYREAYEFDSTSAEAFTAGNLPRALFLAQRAQVHATLALAVTPDAGLVEAYVHDDHGSAYEKSCAACAEESWQGRETRECVLTCIGAFMPDAWDWGRLENEFIGRIGVAIEDASLRELKEFRAHLLQLRGKPAAAGAARGSDVPPW